MLTIFIFSENALQYFFKSIELAPDDPITYLNVGIIYHLLGDTKNASFYTAKGNEIKAKQERKND